ncbi:MAG: DsbA family oxidoreductase [Acidimicrobiales bacterium]
MLVEIWSDVVCPWCYIGKRRFEAALARFEHAADVEVRWKSFELDPSAPFRRSGTMSGHLAAKYGMTVEAAEQRLADLDRLAAAEGLDFHLQDTKGGNTFSAHRLVHLGYEYDPDVGGKVKEALLHAYFGECRPASDPEVLVEVGVAAGLDPSQVEDLVSGDRFAGAVRADEAEAAALGCTGVPFFVVDRAVAVPGAQDSETFLNVLRKAWAQSHPVEMVGAGNPALGGEGACAGGSCVI